MKKPILVVHFGRSGSTVLGAMLDQHSQISWHTEFLTKFMKKRPHQEINLDKIDEISRKEAERSSKRHCGFEIKYLNFQQPNVSVDFLDYLDRTGRQGTPIIMLSRQNTLARLVSVQKAFVSQEWHRHTGSGFNETRVSLPIGNIIDYDTCTGPGRLSTVIHEAREVESRIWTHIRRQTGGLELTYENDILPDPRIAYNRVCDHLELPRETPSVPLQKTSRGLAQDLENFNQVKNELHGTPFEWMLA